MSNQKSLLIIDAMHLDQPFRDYFSQFGFQLIQQSKLPQNHHDFKSVAALLINSSFIENDETILDTLCQRYSIPIIIISDTHNKDISVRLLEAGADDFMIKPIHPRELHARICAITRRVQWSTQAVNHEKEVLTFANWRLYPTSRRLFSGHREQPISAKEYDLLLAFVRHPQRILDRDYLSHMTQCSGHRPLDRRIDVQICRLRNKIEVDAKKPVLIKTIRTCLKSFYQ